MKKSVVEIKAEENSDQSEFEKLVFQKQKEIDALKQLYKVLGKMDAKQKNSTRKETMMNNPE